MKNILFILPIILLNFSVFSQKINSKQNNFEIKLFAENNLEIKASKPNYEKPKIIFLGKKNQKTSDERVSIQIKIIADCKINTVRMKQTFPKNIDFEDKFNLNKKVYFIKKNIYLNVGLNKFEVITQDKKFQTKKINFTIERISNRKDYALIFAVSNYNRGGLANLPNCIKNANDLSNVLKNNYNFETRVVKNPSAKQIKNILREYHKKKYGENDQLLIYFTGHGKYDGISGSFLAKNGSEIEHSVFRKYADGNCKHILIIADACYSGLITDMADISAIRKEMAKKENTNNLNYKNLLAKRTRKVLSSGEKTTSTGVDGGNSRFTNDFIKILNKKDKKVVNFYDIAYLLHTKNPQYKSGYFKNDNQGSNFIFVKK